MRSRQQPFLPFWFSSSFLPLEQQAAGLTLTPITSPSTIAADHATVHRRPLQYPLVHRCSSPLFHRCSSPLRLASVFPPLCASPPSVPPSVGFWFLICCVFRASKYSVWFPGSRPRISGGVEMLWELGCREKIMGK